MMTDYPSHFLARLLFLLNHLGKLEISSSGDREAKSQQEEDMANPSASFGERDAEGGLR